MSDEKTPLADQPGASPWRPFEEARALARGLKLTSKKEWTAWANTAARPPDVPKDPDKQYAGSWVDWKDWLGTRKTYRPFAEARAFVRTLGLKTWDDWKGYAASGQLPSDIPEYPYDHYRGQGWVNWPDFLGRTAYLPFEQARAFVRGLGLKNRREWKQYAQSPARPDNIPAYPDDVYRGKGWVGVGDWVGQHNRWNRLSILAFLDALRPALVDLEPAEVYAILLRNGLVDGDFRKNSNAGVIKALEGLCRTGTLEQITDQLEKTAVEVAETEEGSPPEPAGAADQDAATPPGGELQTVTPAALVEVTDLPELRSLDSLKAADTLTAGRVVDDEATLEFLVNNRVSGLWKKVLDQDPLFSVDQLRAAQGGVYFEQIRRRFLEQYEAAVNLPVPAAYAYQKDGRPAPPILMQRLTAWRVREERRVGNWSGVGAGKTVSAVMSALVVEARLTVIVAFNSTLDMWAEEIKAVCPTADVRVRDRGPFRLAADRPTFVVINYESFQQPWAETELIPNLTRDHRIDFVILDEIQSVRQRSQAEESTRRRMVRQLLTAAETRNPTLHVLGMSATPVINDLHEARVTLELVTGNDFSNVPTAFSVSNAILFHQLLTRHGLRYRPKHAQPADLTVLPIDGQGILPDLARLAGRSNIAALERALLKAKLPYIVDRLRPGTLIYTQFVEEMVEPLAEAVRRKGLTVGVFTGEDKGGLDPFRRAHIDVLIGSEPIGTGIDGLQKVSNRLIFASLPWTSAHYEQVVGRLQRRGSSFDRVELIVPLVELTQEGDTWSWDRYRWQCIQYKRTIADAAVDGVIPKGKLPTRDEMYRRSFEALQKWVCQLGQEHDPGGEPREGGY